jgi:hypothetical protein
MKIALAALAVFSLAGVLGAQTQTPMDYKVTGSMSVTGPTGITETVKFRFQLDYPAGAIAGVDFGTVTGPAWIMSTGPLKFGLPDENASSQGYLPFFDGAKDEYDLAINDLVIPATFQNGFGSSYLFSCFSLPCAQDFGASVGQEGIFLYGTSEVTITPVKLVSTHFVKFIAVEQVTNYTVVNAPATVVWTFYAKQPSTLGSNAVFQVLNTYTGGFLAASVPVNLPNQTQTGGDILGSLDAFIECPGSSCDVAEVESKAGLREGKGCPADAPIVTLYAPQLLNPPTDAFCFDKSVHVFMVELKLNSTEYTAEEVASFKH